MTGQPSPLVSLNKAGYETVSSGGGGTSRWGRLTRHKSKADLTQTMDYDKFMNRWITRRHGVTTEIPTFQKSAGGISMREQKHPGVSILPICFFLGGSNLMQVFTGKFEEIAPSGSLFG